MTRIRSIFLLVPCMTILAAAAGAAQTDPVIEPVMRPAKDGALVNLSATASVELANDQAEVSFYAAESAKSLAEATQKVLKRVNAGLDKIKALGVKAQFETTNLSSYPRYNEPKKGEAAKIVSWEVRQNITATVGNVNDAARIAQAAAEDFAFSGVRFSLSEAAQSSVQEQLMRAAIKSIRDQAAVVASELGAAADDVRVVTVNFNRENAGIGIEYKNSAPMLASRASMDAAAAMPLPQFEPGKSKVSRQVSAQVRVQP